MSPTDARLAVKTWSQHMRDQQIGLGFFDAEQREVPYQSQIERAKAWLGNRYLLAHDINKRKRK